MEDKKSSLMQALSKVISTSIRPTMYLEKIPAKSSDLKLRVYELLYQDSRIEAFNAITNIDSSINLQNYLDVVLYAARFLLANKLSSECYLFLAVAQSRVESVYGTPYDYSLYEEIGNMFYLIKNYAEAIKWYEKLLEIGERNSSVLYFNIGMCYQESGNYSGAIQAYLKSINLDSTFLKSIISLGHCYQTLGQHDKAIGTFKQLPSSSEAYVAMGNSYFFLKNYEEAISNYLKAIKINPAAGVYNNLGVALKKAGLLQDAIFAFNDALSFENTGETLSNLITLYIEVGKAEEAENLFNSSKKLLSAQDNKYFSRLVGEKMSRYKRSTIVPSKDESNLSKNINGPEAAEKIITPASVKKPFSLNLKK
jgi:tetratricopeptide (TPR) repeat protein